MKEIEWMQDRFAALFSCIKAVRIKFVLKDQKRINIMSGSDTK